MNPLVERRGLLAAELSASIRDLGQVRAAIARTQADVWNQTAGMGVTERREETRYAVADLVAEAEDLVAEADALRVQIAHIDVELVHGGSDGT